MWKLKKDVLASEALPIWQNSIQLHCKPYVYCGIYLTFITACDSAALSVCCLNTSNSGFINVFLNKVSRTFVSSKLSSNYSADWNQKIDVLLSSTGTHARIAPH